jgi:hypothetical protein
MIIRGRAMIGPSRAVTGQQDRVAMFRASPLLPPGSQAAVPGACA